MRRERNDPRHPLFHLPRPRVICGRDSSRASQRTSALQGSKCNERPAASVNPKARSDEDARRDELRLAGVDKKASRARLINARGEKTRVYA